MTIKQLRRDERRIVARWCGGFNLEPAPSTPPGDAVVDYLESLHGQPTALEARFLELVDKCREGGAA